MLKPSWYADYESDHNFKEGFPLGIRRWIKKRDGERCNFPLIENGEFAGFKYNAKAKLQAHHISPRAYSRIFLPSVNPHNILNGITLSKPPHDIIHNAWIEAVEESWANEVVKPTRNVDEYLYYKAEQGHPLWETKYDEYLTAIASINSFKMLREGHLPFS